MDLHKISDDKLIELLSEIDSICRDYDHYEYGIPIGLEDREGNDLNNVFVTCIRNWFLKHKEEDRVRRYKISASKWRENHREDERERQRLFREKNPDKVKERNAKWNAKRRKEYQQQYRLRQKENK